MSNELDHIPFFKEYLLQVTYRWLIHVLGQFLKSYTRLNVHLITEFWHHPVAHDDVDLAISYGSAEHTGRRVVRLGQSEFFPVCSPRIMNGLTKPRDLTGMTLLHDYSEETWSRWMLEAGFEDFDDRRDIYFDSAHMALVAARAGYGVGQWEIDQQFKLT